VDLHRDAKGKRHSIPVFKHLSGLIHNWEIAGIGGNTNVSNPKTGITSNLFWFV
jgi:hypothetical protein